MPPSRSAEPRRSTSLRNRGDVASRIPAWTRVSGNTLPLVFSSSAPRGGDIIPPSNLYRYASVSFDLYLAASAVNASTPGTKKFCCFFNSISCLCSSLARTVSLISIVAAPGTSDFLEVINGSYWALKYCAGDGLTGRGDIKAGS